MADDQAMRDGADLRARLQAGFTGLEPTVPTGSPLPGRHLLSEGGEEEAPTILQGGPREIPWDKRLPPEDPSD
jgi:hypothetical protein